MLTEDIVRIQIESANDSRAEPAACIVARGNGVSLEDAQFALATLHGI